MSQRQISVGTQVVMQDMHPSDGAVPQSYRIEQRFESEGGTTLYKIRCEKEPFDRVVGEADFAQS